MDVTKSFRKLAKSIHDNVEEENRTPVYQTLLEEFEECEFQIYKLLGIDPYLDEVLQEMYPEEILELEEEEDENADPDRLTEVGVLDSVDEVEDGYERGEEDETW